MKKLIIVLYVVIILFLGVLYFMFDKEKNNNFENSILRTIKVDIKGAVNNPGVKEISYGLRVSDVIKESGGLLDNADTSMINLSKVVNDEDVIIIYTKDEIKNNEEIVRIVDKECICPVITNNSCVLPKFTNIENKSLISINSASLEQLMNLPGIGESKAKLIIEYREKSLFNTLEEIMNVKGIGKALFEKIKDYITL